MTETILPKQTQELLDRILLKTECSNTKHQIEALTKQAYEEGISSTQPKVGSQVVDANLGR